MADTLKQLRFGTQKPLFGLRQEAANRIEELENYLAEIERITWREGRGRTDMEQALIDIRRISSAATKVTDD